MASLTVEADIASENNQLWNWYKGEFIICMFGTFFQKFQSLKKLQGLWSTFSANSFELQVSTCYKSIIKNFKIYFIRLSILNNVSDLILHLLKLLQKNKYRAVSL